MAEDYLLPFTKECACSNTDREVRNLPVDVKGAVRVEELAHSSGLSLLTV